MYEGEQIELLPSIIQSVSLENQIVLFHTHVANQFPTEFKKNFEELLKELTEYPPRLY